MVTSLNLTKLDCLSGFKEIKIGVRYTLDGQELDTMPSTIHNLAKVEVEYETVPGWEQSLEDCRTFEDLPPQAQAYIKRIEEHLGVPIRWIGVGPGRLDIIDRGKNYELKRID